MLEYFSNWKWYLSFIITCIILSVCYCYVKGFTIYLFSITTLGLFIAFIIIAVITDGIYKLINKKKSE